MVLVPSPSRRPTETPHLFFPGLPSLWASQLHVAQRVTSLTFAFSLAQSSDRGWQPLEESLGMSGLGEGLLELRRAPEISEHSSFLDLSTLLPSVRATERLFSRNPDFKTSLGLFSSRSFLILCFPVASRQRPPCLPLLQPRPALLFTPPAQGRPGLALSSGRTPLEGAAPLARPNPLLA